VHTPQATCTTCNVLLRNLPIPLLVMLLHASRNDAAVQRGIGTQDTSAARMRTRPASEALCARCEAADPLAPDCDQDDGSAQLKFVGCEPCARLPRASRQLRPLLITTRSNQQVREEKRGRPASWPFAAAVRCSRDEWHQEGTATPAAVTVACRPVNIAARAHLRLLQTDPAPDRCAREQNDA
jgi:hypothetical protein